MIVVVSSAQSRIYRASSCGGVCLVAWCGSNEDWMITGNQKKFLFALGKVTVKQTKDKRESIILL